MKVTKLPKTTFVPEAEITVPHEGKEVTFLAPYFGSAGYLSLRTGTQKAGLRMPNFRETVSLAYDALVADREGKYSEPIRSLMSSSWLRASNGLLYVPKNDLHPEGGVYIDELPVLVNNELAGLNKGLVSAVALESRIKSGDSSVRFVPFGYKTETQTSKELENNPFIVGLAGKEGASKLAEMADKFSRKPYVWSFTNVNEPTVRFVSLDSGEIGDDRLGVFGYGWGGNSGGCAFGVSPVSKSA